MYAIRIEGLMLTAPRGVLLEGFSLAVENGEKCTLTGPSGSGKSTLLRCLLGFATPAAGKVSVWGEPVGPATVWRLRQRIAWVPQEPDLGEGTAREALERPFRFRANRELARNLGRTAALAEAFRLDRTLLGQPVAKLSGGEKQRIAIMAALLLDRPLLLLDEASSALDADSRAAVAAHLMALESTTVVSVTHDPANFGLGERIVSLPGQEATHGAA